MRTDAEHVLCRFHLSSLTRHGLSPLFEWIVHVARAEGLQGATVLKGILGLRADGTIIPGRSWGPARDLPAIVEVIDAPARIARLLRLVEPALEGAIVTLERARVLLYRAGREGSGAAMAPAATAASGVHAAGEVSAMQIPGNGTLLRIFIGESDREPATDRPLYEAIVRRAKEAGLAGATVLRGPMGFGRHSRVHTAKVLELSTDLPIVIEIVDAEEKIAAFLPAVDALVSEGLVTIEAVRVLKYASPDHR